MVKKIKESKVFGSAGRLTDSCTFKFLNEVSTFNDSGDEVTGSRYRILYNNQPVLQVVNWDNAGVNVEVMYDADDLPINYMSDNFDGEYDSWEELVDALDDIKDYDMAS